MPVLVSSATNRRTLLALIRDFLTPLGWTVVYDQITAKGGMGIGKGVCQLVIGEERNSSDTASTSNTASDLINGGTIANDYLRACLVQTINPAITRYWGHTTGPTGSGAGGFGSGLTTGGGFRINDLNGPFNTVWLFADAAGNYCNVVVLSAPNRFTHFGFGILDKLGMTHPDVAYLCTQYYVFWPNQTTPSTGSYGPNNPRFNGGEKAWQPLCYFVPTGVHNAAFSMGNGLMDNSRFQDSYRPDNGRIAAFGDSSIDSKISDPYLFTVPDLTTGGTPLWPLPSIQADLAANVAAVYLGDLPDVRIISMDNRTPGEIITQGADQWRVFPMKQMGAEANMFNGANPTATVNTGTAGFAFRILT